jgi:hypothetical protein
MGLGHLLIRDTNDREVRLLPDSVVMFIPSKEDFTWLESLEDMSDVLSGEISEADRLSVETPVEIFEFGECEELTMSKAESFANFLIMSHDYSPMLLAARWTYVFSSVVPSLSMDLYRSWRSLTTHSSFYFDSDLLAVMKSCAVAFWSVFVHTDGNEHAFLITANVSEKPIYFHYSPLFDSAPSSGPPHPDVQWFSAPRRVQCNYSALCSTVSAERRYFLLSCNNLIERMWG